MRRSAVMFATVLVGLSSSSVSFFQPYSLAVRILAILVLMIGARGHGFQDGGLGVTGPWIFAGFNVTFLMLSTLPHGRETELPVRLLAVALFCVLIWLLAYKYAREDVLIGLLRGLSVLLAAGYGLLAVPSIAYEQGRFRGLYENANLLGFACFLLAFLAIWFRKWWTFAGVLLASVFGLVLSGSRGGALALASGLVGLVFVAKNRRAIRVMLTIALATLVCLLAWPSAILGLSVLRDNNSRADALGAATDALQQSPLFGYGLGQDGVVSANYAVAGTPFAVAVQAGFVGIGVLGMAYLLLMASAKRLSPIVASFCGASIIHSLIEGWMLSLSGPIALFFAMTWVAIAGTPSDRNRGSNGRYSGPSSTDLRAVTPGVTGA